jgi:hypothetical protein
MQLCGRRIRRSALLGQSCIVTRRWSDGGRDGDRRREAGHAEPDESRGGSHWTNLFHVSFPRSGAKESSEYHRFRTLV